uniref:PolyA_pol_RNAbd domain-containing protein n=1 Tax=Anisakis simplex TaxID=6269 RepID=A0A0M3KHU7_ANISI
LGLPIHLDVLQITQSNIDTILETIRNHGSDIIRLKPIMERLPDGFIDYNRLKIIFALLEYEYGVEEEEENKGKEVEDSQDQRSPPVDWNSYRFDSALRSANFRTCSSQKADTVGSLSQPSSSSRTVDVSSANSSQPNAADSSSTSTTSKRRLPQWMTSDVTAKLASQSSAKKQKKSNLFR